MTIEQMRERLKAIMAQLDVFAGLEQFSDEQLDELNVLNDEATNLTKQIEAKERLESIKAAAGASNRKTTPAPGPVEVKATRKEKNGGFENFGEFLSSVKNASAGSVDKRFQNAMFEKSGEDGGFLVPEEMFSDIAKKIEGDESLLSRTRQFQVSGNNLSLPTDELQPWSGGITAYWTAEGAPHTDSKHAFGTASWRLHKLSALIKTTDELLADTVALESYISALAPVAITHKLNEAILSGNGVGKPTGILNSGFKVVVDAESGQSSDTIVARNVIKMYNRMIPSSRASAVWYINPACEDQLRTMVDDNGNFIYLSPGSQMNQSPYGLLLGRPVLPLLGGMQNLGDEGDIMFVDLGYYYTIVKSGNLTRAISTHLYFDRDLTAYKFIFRVDGSCPFKTPVQIQNGSYQMSAFVTLEDR
jgi:HK97 family phage major capsid protein